jgi:CspA family cold shock protein
MSETSRSIVCQRCGRGFVLTSSYRHFLSRRGIKVKVPMLCMTCFLKAGPLPKQEGEVKWFNPRKRYGFIVTEEGQDIFVHQQQILARKGNEPHEGQTVRFHLQHSPKGPEAVNVELV